MNAPLMLPAELTIYVVHELRATWLEQLERLEHPASPEPPRGDADALPVDGAAVQEVDAAGVQCLLSLAGSLRSRGRTLRVEGASDRLAHACHALGARHLLAAAPAAAPGTEMPS
jgi:anti-anti-sigma regulatory factor